MRDAYHEELDAITEQLVEMTQLVGQAISLATQALLNSDLAVAESVIDSDESIDILRENVDRRTVDLIARQQPVAGDLRALTTGLRITSDLERSGDLAVHVAKLARRKFPACAVPDELQATVREMGAVAADIVGKAGDVVASRDAAKAAELESDDDVMDHLHRTLAAHHACTGVALRRRHRDRSRVGRPLLRAVRRPRGRRREASCLPGHRRDGAPRLVRQLRG